MSETLCCIICGALHHSTQWHDAAVAEELAERDAHTLKLVQTFHWYDETQSGRKRVEYRKMSPHWKKLIWDKRAALTHVRFQRGFHPPIQQQTFAIAQIDIGSCPIDGWNDQYYRVFFK